MWRDISRASKVSNPTLSAEAGNFAEAIADPEVTDEFLSIWQRKLQDDYGTDLKKSFG